jgi:hypothetical protein
MRSFRAPALVFALALLGGLSIWSCSGEPRSPGEPPSEALQKARAAADALSKDLKARLVRELGAEGPIGAVRVCSEVAQEVAARHSVEGLMVRRVSLKWRNPADQPDEYERAALEQLEEQHAAGRLPDEVYEMVEQPEGKTLRYLRPIKIVGACLNCHGDPEKMPSEVAALVRERYPEDNAVGYRAGDLRGVVSVQVRLEDQAD